MLCVGRRNFQGLDQIALYCDRLLVRNLAARRTVPSMNDETDLCCDVGRPAAVEEAMVDIDSQPCCVKWMAIALSNGAFLPGLRATSHAPV